MPSMQNLYHPRHFSPRSGYQKQIKLKKHHIKETEKNIAALFIKTEHWYEAIIKVELMRVKIHCIKKAIRQQGYDFRDVEAAYLAEIRLIKERFIGHYRDYLKDKNTLQVNITLTPTLKIKLLKLFETRLAYSAKVFEWFDFYSPLPLSYHLRQSEVLLEEYQQIAKVLIAEKQTLNVACESDKEKLVSQFHGLSSQRGSFAPLFSTLRQQTESIAEKRQQRLAELSLCLS